MTVLAIYDSHVLLTFSFDPEVESADQVPPQVVPRPHWQPVTLPALGFYL